jgi:hypothetical protein
MGKKQDKKLEKGLWLSEENARFSSVPPLLTNTVHNDSPQTTGALVASLNGVLSTHKMKDR